MKDGSKFGIGCAIVIALIGYWLYDGARDRDLVYALPVAFHGPVEIERNDDRGAEIERHWSRFVYHIPPNGVFLYRGRDPLTQHWWHITARYEDGRPVEIRDSDKGWPLNGFPIGTPKPGPNTFGMYQVLGCGRWSYFVGTLHECNVWVELAQAEYQEQLRRGE